MATSLLVHPRFRLIFFSVWTAWAFLHALMVRSFSDSWSTAIMDSAVANVLLLGCGLVLMNILQYYVPQKERYDILLVWVISVSLIWLLLTRLLLQALLPGAAFEKLVKPTLFIRFSIGFLIIGNWVLVCVVWYNWQEQKALQERRTEAAELAKEAELYKLRQQLQPHFLFNSLNSINALIGSQPAQARKMVLQLSDFLRGTLKKEEQQWVTLGEELDYLQLYLEIEKVRFGHRLSTSVSADPEAHRLLLPALLLQPVVENAIKFGLYDTIDDITIEIRAHAADDTLVVSVQNPFDPQTTLPRGTGFGLSSIQRRLHLLFGRSDLLTTTTTDHLFTATLTLPQHQLHHK